MPTIDEQIAQKLREARDSGELASAPSWGKPMDLDDAFAETPEELRMGYKALKNAGFAPPEVEAMREIAELKKTIEDDPNDPEAQTRLRRLSVLRQHLALRLERMRPAAKR